MSITRSDITQDSVATLIRQCSEETSGGQVGPTLAQYKQWRAKGTRTPESMLYTMGYEKSAAGWSEMVNDFTGLPVPDGYLARSQSRLESLEVPRDEMVATLRTMIKDGYAPYRRAYDKARPAGYPAGVSLLKMMGRERSGNISAEWEGLMEELLGLPVAPVLRGPTAITAKPQDEIKSVLQAMYLETELQNTRQEAAKAEADRGLVVSSIRQVPVGNGQHHTYYMLR